MQKNNDTVTDLEVKRNVKTEAFRMKRKPEAYRMNYKQLGNKGLNLDDNKFPVTIQFIPEERAKRTAIRLSKTLIKVKPFVILDMKKKAAWPIP